MSFVPDHDVSRADTAIEGVPPIPMSAFARGEGLDRLDDSSSVPRLDR